MVRRPSSPAPLAAPAPPVSPLAVPLGASWWALLQGASAALDAVEGPREAVRADEPAHTTALRREPALDGAPVGEQGADVEAGVLSDDDGVVVRPGWGGATRGLASGDPDRPVARCLRG